MPRSISIQHDTTTTDGTADALRLAAEATLQHLGIEEAALSILLSDDDTLRELNRTFRGEDNPTDVLSFPAGNDMQLPPGFMDNYLGDIAISVATASRQASVQRHGLIAELQLLTIHGILHLLEYDHLEAAEKEEMWAIQRAVLAILNLHDVEPTEDV